MAEFKGISNIVNCDDVQYFPKKQGVGWDILIKMELLTPLGKVLDKNFNEKQVVRLGIGICNALTLCKSKNIVHRDIKPQNILVSNYGQYKLADFGIAKIAEKTSCGTKTGTYNYMAPEVYNNQPYGSAADIYSLGMVLYWMLNEHRTPFLTLPPQTPDWDEMEYALRRRFQGEPLPAPAHGSKKLKEIVLKACAYRPEDRYVDAAQMCAELKKILIQNEEEDSPTVAAPKLVELPKDFKENTESKEESILWTPALEETSAKVWVKEDETRDEEDVREVDLSKNLQEKAEETGSKNEFQVQTDEQTNNDYKEAEKPVGSGMKKGILSVLILCVAIGLISLLSNSTKSNDRMVSNDTGNYGKETATEENYQEESNIEDDDTNSTEYSYNNVQVGDVITLETYEQDNNTSNGKEDIEWQVLDKEGNKILVISKYALDCQPYNTEWVDITWETCTLRDWLNDEFINTAFTGSEKAMIPTVTVTADENPEYDTDPGNDTQHKIYLLSIEEVVKYFASDEAMMCEATAYAEAQGAYISSSYGTCFWWLRSLGDLQNYAAGVYASGGVNESGVRVYNDNAGVRPALWITLEP